MVSGFWHFEVFGLSWEKWWPVLGEKEERMCCTSAAFFTPYTILSISSGLCHISPWTLVMNTERMKTIPEFCLMIYFFVKICLSVPFALFSFPCHSQFFLLSYPWELLLQLFILSLECVWVSVCVYVVCFFSSPPSLFKSQIFDLLPLTSSHTSKTSFFSF